jgi:hypothetical protein
MTHRLLRVMELALKLVAFKGNHGNQILDSLDTMDGRCSDVPIAGRSIKTLVETRGTLIAGAVASPAYRESISYRNKSLTARLLGRLQERRWLERLAAAQLALSLVRLLGRSSAQRCLRWREIGMTIVALIVLVPAYMLLRHMKTGSCKPHFWVPFAINLIGIVAGFYVLIPTMARTLGAKPANDQNSLMAGVGALIVIIFMGQNILIEVSALFRKEVQPKRRSKNKNEIKN